MTLKERINSEFTEAYKAKNMFKKTALGMLKTKITEAEKKEGKELNDSDIISVVSSAVKQIDQTILSYTENKADEEKINDAIKEKEILASYLPKQMTDAEMKAEVLVIMEDMIFPPDQAKQALGGIMKHFKTNYNGQYNPVNLKSIIDEIFA